jgi:hypothetical protein
VDVRLIRRRLTAGAAPLLAALAPHRRPARWRSLGRAVVAVQRLDAAYLAPGSSHALGCVRAGLAALIGVRVAVGPYAALAHQPDALFVPTPPVAWLPSMPPVWVIVAVQVVGVAAALACVAGRRRRLAFAVAWLALLFLAGLRGSLGKVLHNDVLLLLAAVPLLPAPDDARPGHDRRSSADGWPVRAALAVAAAVYFLAGVQKLRHSGLGWVTSDNMRWVLYGGAASGRAPTESIAVAIADRPWASHLAAAGILGLELVAPVALALRRWRPWFAAAAVALHVGTWLTLGLDYWGWALTILVVAAPWDRLSPALGRSGRAHAAAAPARSPG